MQHPIGQSNRLGAEYQIAEPWSAARSDLPLLLKVRVRNTGAIAWPDDPQRPINLSYHWLDQRGRIVDYEGVRSTLPEPLSPGQTTELELSVEPPPRAGSYVLELDMVEEHVGWFSRQGVAPLAVPIEVAPAPLGRPRVCIVNGNCLLNDAVGNHVVNQLRFFLERGYDPLVLVEEANPRQPAELRRHIFQITLDELRAGVDNPQTRRAIQHFQDADLYVFNYSTYYRLAEAIEMVDHGVLLFDYHGITPAQFWDGPGLDVLIEGQRKLSLARHADYAIVHSAYARDELLASGGISPERVSVLPYAVPLARFRPAPRDPALAARYGLDDRVVLLYVGRMAGNKRVIDLVRALPLVHAQHPDALLLLVGDKQQAAYARIAAEAQAEAHALGVADHVIFTGAVDHDQLDAYYNSCDVYVTSSLHEGFCIPVIEALACGKPVVGARTTALPETIGSGGLTFQPLDPADLARQILAVLDRTPPSNEPVDLLGKEITKDNPFQISAFDERPTANDE